MTGESGKFSVIVLLRLGVGKSEVLNKAGDIFVPKMIELEEDRNQVEREVIGYGGDEVRIIYAVSSLGLVSVLSHGAVLSTHYSYKTSHSTLYLSLRSLHIK